MKPFKFLIVCILMWSKISGQTPNVDSICAHINAANGPYKQAIRLENGLRQLSEEKISRDKFIPKLNIAKMDSRILLLLDAYDSKIWIRSGEFDKLLAEKNSLNPYTLFHVGNAQYLIGQNDSAMQTWKRAAAMTLEYEDSGYTSSMYVNIGALNWMSNNLDSALVYFLKARDITSWYNETLEANILAITNTIEDYELSRKQIDLILSKDPESKNGPFLVNWMSFLKATNPELLDSVQQLVQERFQFISEIPEDLLPTYVENGWRADSILNAIGSMNPTSNYHSALEKLFGSPFLTQLSDSTLKFLIAKSSDEDINALLKLILVADSNQRSLLAETFNTNIFLPNESIKRLKFTAEKYEAELKNLETSQQALIFTSLITLLIISLFIIVQQRKIIRSNKVQKILNEKKKKLELSNTKLDSEIRQLRKTIQEFSEKSLKEIQNLKKWVKSLNLEGDSKNQHHFQDLTIISTYINGVQRFKIREYCRNITSNELKILHKILGQKEIEIIKLISVGFKSKEIALLLDVSPQYINNVRYQIRNILSENKLELDDVINKFKSNLSFESS